MAGEWQRCGARRGRLQGPYRTWTLAVSAAPINPVTPVWACCPCPLRCIPGASRGGGKVSRSRFIGLRAPSASAASQPLTLPRPGARVASPWGPGILDPQPSAALALSAPLPLTAPGTAAQDRGLARRVRRPDTERLRGFHLDSQSRCSRALFLERPPFYLIPYAFILILHITVICNDTASEEPVAYEER